MHKILSKQQGFTLTELLVVIVVIGILILLAFPELTSVVTKAKETEAKVQLKHLHSLMEAYYFERDSYTMDLQAIGFQQKKLVSEGGQARYKIEMVKASNYEFLAKAVATVDFDKDGTFNVWTIDQEGNLVQTVPD